MVFSSESVLHVRRPKYWSFSFSISLSDEYSGLISFRIGWLDLLEVQGISRVFSNESTPHEVAKVLEFQLEHHSFQRNPRADLLQNGLVGSPCSPRGLSRVFSTTTVQKHQFFSAQPSSQSSSHIHHTTLLEKP